MGTSLYDLLGQQPDVAQAPGLFSDADRAAAKMRGILGFAGSLMGDSGDTGGAIGRALQTGVGTYDKTLDNSLAQQMAQGQLSNQRMSILAQQQQLAQQLKMQQVRQQIAQQYPAAPNESQEQVVARLNKIFAALVNAGDHEMASKVGEVLKSYGNSTEKDSVDRSDLGDRVEYYDHRTGKMIRVEKKGLTPKTPAEISAETKFHADQKNKIRDDFFAETKKMEDIAGAYATLKAAVENPSLATPFAVADAYGRASMPGQALRPTTLEMIHQMGSIDQKFRSAVAKGYNGMIPQDVLNDWVRNIQAQIRNYKKVFDDAREAAMRRAEQEGIPRKEMDAFLTQYDFPDLLAKPSAPPAGSAAKVMGPLKLGGKK